MAPASATAAPRVSVIIIFFDAEPFLAEAIESVLAQSYGDFELLLCDDGSTDGGTALAKACAGRLQPKVRYLEHPGHVNRGMSATRNLGIRNALGEFIAFIDADDVWRPQKLAEQVAILDAHPSVAMVCGAVNYWSAWAGGMDEVIPTGPVLDRPVPPPDVLLNIYPLGRAPAPCPSDLLVRRSACEAVGGFEEHFLGPRMMYEDQGFLNKIYLRAPVYFSSQVWLDYRQHPESCVAEVHRAGQYDEVRGYFLNWFRGYIQASPEPVDPRVTRTLDRAIWLHRRQHWRKALSAPGAVARSLLRFPKLSGS
ncbi:glycosyltransferase family 2 protein [Phenylobacterium sp.]|jgi:glycosyltransferase involved in cell wall biosynthesis|uniref:glycosyltransferase family 2 protein n=1 Tax=Phenylobacterium sp. TaxID=1871053 RepID=UPI002F3ECC35